MLNFTREGVYIWFAATKTRLENHYNFRILDVVGWKPGDQVVITYFYVWKELHR